MANSQGSVVYFVTCRCGVEDVAYNSLVHLCTQYPEVSLLSRPPVKQTVLVSSTCRAVEDPMTAMEPIDEEDIWAQSRGLVSFSFSATVDSEATRRREVSLLLKVGALRSVDHVYLHLCSCSSLKVLEDIDTVMRANKEAIHKAVVGKLSQLRTTAEQLHREESVYAVPLHLQGPSFLTEVSDDFVSFRVHCVRKDKSSKAFTSQDLASHVGNQLVTMFGPAGWRVNMLYHHVEFFALHDHQHTAHLGLVVSAPPLPRVGSDADRTLQFVLEWLRQRIGQEILLHTLTDNSGVRALIPRPTTFRNELRREKGENAMLVGLASALVTYAAIQPYMVVLDPFVGSGGILLEAWLAVQCAPLVLLGSELHEGDSRIAYGNLHGPSIRALGVLHGVLQLPAERMGSLRNTLEAWMDQMKRLVDTVDYQMLTATTALQLSCSGAQELLEEVYASPALSGNYTIDILQANAGRLPLSGCCVDRIVSDLPFGRRCSNHKVNRQLYPRCIQECYRLLRDPAPCQAGGEGPGAARVNDSATWWSMGGSTSQCRGGRAVLLTLEKKLMEETLQGLYSVCPFHVVVPPFTVDMAGLYPFVFVLDKERRATHTN